MFLQTLFLLQLMLVLVYDSCQRSVASLYFNSQCVQPVKEDKTHLHLGHFGRTASI